jgi:pyruvate/2-oxoglutarate dehydrogenase complex dihydrolipoamide dehydrogenase (E3) component
MGGDCLNVGCVPSKAVLHGARVGTPPDFAAAMERMRRLRADLSVKDSATRFRDLGVDVYLGDARFVAPDAVEVDGSRLRFARAVIATGARAAGLPVPGLAEAGFLTNETVFSLTTLPRRLVVIGAGPIGCELAQAFRRFGSAVTIVSLDPRLLPREDDVASTVLAARFAREGIVTALGARLARVERRADGVATIYDRGNGEETAVADAILLAAGRAPNVEGLGLEAARVAYDATGVRVDDRLRTTNPLVYAAGDVCSAYKFTHAADAMARVVIQNALFFGRKRMSRLVIPWCTYTDPEIAHVGVSASEAANRPDVVTLTAPLDDVDRAVLEGETDGFARVHVDGRGRILGATLVSRHAGETIGEVVLAMTAGLRLGAIGETIHPYPTQSEMLKRLSDAYRRRALTPGVKRLFEGLMRLRR